MNTNDAHALPGTESADKETRQQVKRMWLFAPSILLRLEGLVVLTLSAIFYAVEGGNWWLYLLLFFSLDLSMLGYLAGNRIGALCYNLVHTSVLPLALLTVGLLTKHMLIVQLTLIWLSHIGFDRVLASGLKYPTAFQETHFNRLSSVTSSFLSVPRRDERNNDEPSNEPNRVCGRRGRAHRLRGSRAGAAGGGVPRHG